MLNTSNYLQGIHFCVSSMPFDTLITLRSIRMLDTDECSTAIAPSCAVVAFGRCPAGPITNGFTTRILTVHDATMRP
jgi:hypothetical protein